MSCADNVAFLENVNLAGPAKFKGAEFIHNDIQGCVMFDISILNLLPRSFEQQQSDFADKLLLLSHIRESDEIWRGDSKEVESYTHYQLTGI